MKVVGLNPADKIACILAALCTVLERDLSPDAVQDATQSNVVIHREEETLADDLVLFALKILESSADALLAHAEYYTQEALVLGERLSNRPNASLTTTFSFLCAHMQRRLETPENNTPISFQP